MNKVLTRRDRAMKRRKRAAVVLIAKRTGMILLVGVLFYVTIVVGAGLL